VIPFDTFVLAAVASELRRSVPGAKVQKVQQPSPAEIVLSLYGRAGAHKLLLSADPLSVAEIARLVAVSRPAV